MPWGGSRPSTRESSSTSRTTLEISSLYVAAVRTFILLSRTEVHLANWRWIL
jgi:hypothetical protein